jgi:hypothetical protein
MKDDVHSLKWMSGSTQYTANFHVFAEALGYPLDGPSPLGAQFFSPESLTRILSMSLMSGK